MIQDIKDRVPVNVLSNNAIRYGIYDEQGNLIRYEYIKREDEPAEVGTAINKALFNNLQGDLYTNDRYNKLLIKEGIEPVDYKTDIIISEELIQGDCIPKDWTFQKLESLTATSSSGNIKLHYTNQSGYVSDTMNGINIFDGNDNTSTYMRGYSHSSRAIIEFDRYIKVKKFKLYMGPSTSGIVFEFVGSNDNATFTTLYADLKASSGGSIKEYEIENPEYYKYYGLKVSSTAANSVYIYELQISEYYDNVVFGKNIYINNLSLPLTSYEVGKIVNIEGSSYFETREVTKTGNIFPTTWVEEIAGLKYVSDNGYILEASSSTNTSDYPVSNVSDGNEDTCLAFNQNQQEHWVKMTCPKSTKISKLRFKPYLVNTRYIESCIIQGSNDDMWVNLYELSSNTEIPGLNEKIFLEYTIPNPDYYKNYRIYIRLSTTGSFNYIYEWQTTEYIEIEEGIETVTSFENPYLNINNLGAKQINGTIEAGQQYKLVYNGESFDIVYNSISGVYTGSGTYGTGNENCIDVGFQPSCIMIECGSYVSAIIFPNLLYGLTKYHTRDELNELTVSMVGTKVYWYGSSEIIQMNTNKTYRYVAFR